MINKSAGRVRRSAAILGASLLLVTGAWGLTAGTATAQEAACWPTPPNMDLGYPQFSSAPQNVIDTSKTYTATIETNRGDIVIELADDTAPITVNNFICLATSGYYDVTMFHRVIQDFMIQGGDPTGTGTGGPGYSFADELPQGTTPYVRGTLAMANAGPNTNGSQFFIVQTDQPAGFPPNYSIFGHVTQGLDVVDAIAAVPVRPSAQGEPSVPTVTLGIKTITISENGQTFQPVATPSASPVAGTPVADPTVAPDVTPTPVPTVPAVTEENGDDDGGNMPLWIAGGAAVVAAVGYGAYRSRQGEKPQPKTKATAKRKK